MRADEVRVVCALPATIEVNGWPWLERLIDTDEQDRAARLVHPDDRQAFVLAHALRRCVIADELDVVPSALRFSSTHQGAPCLIDGPSDLYFSHSHCRGAVACVVTRVAAVGVDVERADRVTKNDLQSFVVDAEQTREETRFSWAHQWTALEAFWKASGSGLSESNPRLSFSPAAHGRVDVVLHAATPPTVAGVAAWLDHFDDFALAIALLGAHHDFSISRTHCRNALEIKQLCSENRSDNFSPRLNMAA